MEKQAYNDLIKSRDFDKLAKIDHLMDLVHYEYQNKKLIDYLLEQGIHSTEMDNYTKYYSQFVEYYLKYNILKPLLNCTLKTLLRTVNGKLILDELLSKITHEERLELYRNIKQNSYWDFREYEDYIINVYKKYNIELPKLFIERYTIIDNKANKSKLNELLLEDFKDCYRDQNSIILDLLISEFRRGLNTEENYTIYEITELIKYKKENPEFKFILTSATNCAYDKDTEIMKISPYRKGVLSHEISHLLFESNEKDDNLDIIEDYETLCESIINKETKEKITNYLKDFHLRYFGMVPSFEKLYYHTLQKKYRDIYEYIKVISEDIKEHNVSLISTEYDVGCGYYITPENMDEMVFELLITEKEEFIKSEINNYFTYELLLENLLDAILHGQIFDELLDTECLSGHGFFEFYADYTLSFNECMANYAAIKASPKADKLISDLRMLVGDELVDLLDNYLEKNRSNKYGH